MGFHQNSTGLPLRPSQLQILVVILLPNHSIEITRAHDRGDLVGDEQINVARFDIIVQWIPHADV